MFDVFISLIYSISDAIWFLLVPLLLITGIIFTIRSGGVQIRNLPDMFRSLKTQGTSKDSISGIQAFFIGLASRVGTGNIAGVAIAISTGGPGSVFWMWMVAVVGSASAFIESTLAQLYKVPDEETKFRGGPAYYISKGLNSRPLAFAFAILISIAFGLIFVAVQANTIATSLKLFFSDSSFFNTPIFEGFSSSSSAITALISNVTPLGVVMATILCILVAAILFSGSQTIAKISSIIVPVMAILYVILGIIVIAVNITVVPSVIAEILSSAFTPNAAFGATMGVVVQQGVKRGLFSNEAGMGSAPNAAASADVDHPVKQGLIQSLGVFVDTLVVCTVTAFIILIPPTIYASDDGITVTQHALMNSLGEWSVIFLTIAIFFFAFSSILGNYFYAQSNIEFMSDKRMAVNIFKGMVVFMVAFGAMTKSQIVWDMADFFMGLMAIINIFAILMLHDKAILLLKDYREQKKAGKNPVFNASKYSEFDEFEIWKK